MRSLAKTLFRHLVPTPIKESLVRAVLATMPSDRLDRLRVRYDMASTAMSLRHLRHRGFVPNTIIDIGANDGDWTRLAESIYPSASILMIEPLVQSEPRLVGIERTSNGRIRYRRALLGAAQRPDVVFFEKGTGSSILPEQSPFPRTEAHHPMTTLDDVVRETAFPPAALLKLDVQGYELEVLRGGMTALAASEVVLLEVALIGVNRGAPLLDAVVAFMKEHGFLAYDIGSFIRRNLDGALWTVDMIFVAEHSALRASERYQ